MADPGPGFRLNDINGQKRDGSSGGDKETRLRLDVGENSGETNENAAVRTGRKEEAYGHPHKPYTAYLCLPIYDIRYTEVYA